MLSRFPRRRALRGIASAGALALAGCGADSDPENESSDREPPATQGPITADEFTFDVSVEEQFTESHPARIRAALRNDTETMITLSTGVTPPFTSYVSGEESDEDRLVLVPDVSEDENPLDWDGETDPIPTTAENGCWNVTRDVLVEELGAYTELDSGETSEQRYTVYGYRADPCPPTVSYRFEDSTRFHRGDPSDDTPVSDGELGFTLTLADDQTLSVEQHEPTMSGPD